MFEEIIRDTLREYSYNASEDCVAAIAARIEDRLDYQAFVEGGS